MKLDKLKSNWEGLGENDPYWAILTQPSKINNQWDNIEFFKSGQSWINQIFLNLKLDEKINFNSALDFGCGLGRLSQALCTRFRKVTGVDISSSMVRKAISLNKFPGTCEYLVNNTDDLSQFPAKHFDFVLSFITLQHIEPNYTINYIKEFKRVTKDNGYILFNLPTRPPTILNVLLKMLGAKGVNLIRRLYYKKKHVIEMYWIAEDNMLSLFNSNGLELVEIVEDIGVGSDWKSNIYLLKKSGSEQLV